MRFLRPVRLVLLAVVLLALAPLSALAQNSPLEIKFYYPTAVGGPLTQIFDRYAEQFNKANPDIKIIPTYAGGYDDISAAVQTEIAGKGEGPDVAVMLAADLPTFIDNGYIVPMQQFIDKMDDGKAYVDDFFPAFMRNSVDEKGQVWAIPFQRSTPVLYYNKDLFKQVGLDPEKAPKDDKELVEFAKKLTLPDGQRWGIEIPSDGFPYWLFQGFAIGNGQNVVGDSFDEVYFNKPEVVKGLEFFASLSSEGVMPKGVIVWGDAPKDFTAGKAAMIYHTTGSLTNILKNATFDVGVGFLPAGDKGYGAPTGGGNLYIFSTSTPEKQAAAWKWVQYLSSPEIQSDWGAATGYIAARKSAWDVDPLKKLVTEKPQYGIARDQLQYADKELATHQSLDVRNTLGKAIGRVIAGEMSAQESLDQAQKEADAILSQYKSS
jgi:sn-glycerol 3-phosphate transport system substrate-binding protein